jgi:hypothetical protein
MFIGNKFSGFENRRDRPWPVWFLKALRAALKNLLSNRREGFQLAGFEKLSANSKASSAETAKELINSVKNKIKV